MSTRGPIAILVPKKVMWNPEPDFKDWWMCFKNSKGPYGDNGIWLDEPKSMNFYPGQLIVIQETTRKVRGGVQDMYYWEIVDGSEQNS